MTKTDKMELIEARAGGRDIRSVLSEAYEATGSVEKAADYIAEHYTVSVSFGIVHDWITNVFGGSIRKHLEFPGWSEREPAEAVP